MTLIGGLAYQSEMWYKDFSRSIALGECQMPTDNKQTR